MSEYVRRHAQAITELQDIQLQLREHARMVRLYGSSAFADELQDAHLQLEDAIKELQHSFNQLVNTYINAVNQGSRNMLHAALAVSGVISPDMED